MLFDNIGIPDNYNTGRKKIYVMGGSMNSLIYVASHILQVIYSGFKDEPYMKKPLGSYFRAFLLRLFQVQLWVAR